MPLIDLSDAVNVVESYRDRNPDSWSLCNSIKFDIAELPTLSPDEVRSVGEWEKDSDGLDICSECGEIALQRVFLKLPNKIVDLQMIRSNYCPNCGARMKGAEDGTTD